MCGIVGYYGRDAKEIDLSLAAKAILHRGPDSQTIKSGANWTVAFNRLSIIDVSDNGMQPFSFDGVTIFVNGEIYNYLELKAAHVHEYTCRTGSDIEILPFLYRKYGIDFLQKINGMFAMTLIDEKLGVTYLIRDRYGKKPLFYTSTSRGVFFSSELKAIQTMTSLELDKSNIALNFACWFLIQPLTLYKNTFNLNPGSYLELREQNQIREVRWYTPHIAVSSKSFEEIQENFLSLYRRSIELRLRSDVPVGIFLSGGLDSTSQAYLANQLSPQKITAFTAEIQDKELFGQNNTDVEIPARLCRDMGWRNVKTPVNFQYYNQNIVQITENYDEIFINSGVLIFYALAQVASQNGVKVVFTGVGGDELFGGYPWQSRIRKLPIPIARRIFQKTMPPYSHNILKLMLRSKNKHIRNLAPNYQLLDQARIWHAQSLSGLFQAWMTDINQDVSERIDLYSQKVFQNAMSSVEGDLYNQMNWANISTVIGNQNYLADMGCMSNSVENRSPSLDFEVFEYMMSVPDEIKNRSGPKGLLRQIFGDVMPTYVTQAKKSGPTMPLNIWFGDEALRKQINGFVSRNLELISEFVSSDLARVVKSDPDVLYTNKALPLFAVISYLIWAKQRIEKSIPDSSISFTELVKS